MSLLTHLESLEVKHAQLEAEITSEMAHPLPDFTLITQLKKQKLHIKEELARLADPRKLKKASAGT